MVIKRVMKIVAIKERKRVDMKDKVIGIIIIVIMFWVAGCSFNEDIAGQEADLISVFDFETGSQNWEGGIADYPVLTRDSLSFNFDNLQVPNNLLVEGSGLQITSDNPHGDLFYYFVRHITDLKPNTQYKLDFEFLLYVQTDSDIDKSSSDGVYLKIGGVKYEPVLLKQTMTDNQEYMVLNVDKGETNEDSGEDMVMIGDITGFMGVSPEVISGNTFDKIIEVQSNANGSVWLIIGVDSGVKTRLTFGLTAVTVYYTQR